MGVEITLTAELHSDNLSDGLSREEYFANGGAFVWLHDNKVLKSILGVTP